jgi:hypothetical protein
MGEVAGLHRLKEAKGGSVGAAGGDISAMGYNIWCSFGDRNTLFKD